MKTIIKSLCFTFAMTSSLALQAQVISWSFNQNGFSMAGGSGLPYAGPAGVVLASNWNDSWAENYSTYSWGTPVTVNNLYDSTGTATTTSLAYTSDNGYSIGGQPAQDADGSYSKQMLNGFLNAGPAGWGPPTTFNTIALSNIPYSQYEIIVYISDDAAGRVALASDGAVTYDLSTMGSATVSGANASFIQSTDTTGANPTADYVVFTGLSGSSQTITVTPGDMNPNDAAWVGLAAFQIVPVPEPGTLALAALGGIGMLMFRRRH
jgi:hypothetical protein